MFADMEQNGRGGRGEKYVTDYLTLRFNAANPDIGLNIF
jgi:hypothetical protein